VIEIAIGLGVLMSLALQEAVGLSAGGLVVPGYLALQIHEPKKLLGTLLIATTTWLVVKALGSTMILYGRRRLALSVLVGFALGQAWRHGVLMGSGQEMVELAAVGYIVPGLIASWMDRQGPVPTVLCLVLIASCVRLLMMLVTGGVVLIP